MYRTTDIALETWTVTEAFVPYVSATLTGMTIEMFAIQLNRSLYGARLVYKSPILGRSYQSEVKPSFGR